ncbi:hypothetical protein JAAARDRAFT_29599 [Jaapia argillacea MUCL 33604]|uniref:Uncharacterized protein n=1 Tax=Jaapia argillacea MUCL 33604 TaxID=933084 RepID=A0A067QJ83_9AGAM|nr:hypothetical protein JAAARDRAFT_29599 [Jaapia argillacea MUCL 33604]
MLYTKDTTSQAPYTSLPSSSPPSSSSKLIPEPEQHVLAPSYLGIDVGNDTYVPQGGEEPPPEFTPYEAEYDVHSNGHIVSYDHHLNEDGEALYRFLLAQASTPPTFLCHCRGTHTETHHRTVSSPDSHGRFRTRTESYTETITDFDFYLDVGRHIILGPIHWSMADDEPGYRGLMVRQVETSEGRRTATREERKGFKAWLKERIGRGLPPWIPQNSLVSGDPLGNAEVLKSSKTLRQWADEYCASPKYLKEFTYEKVVYGWHIAALKDAIRAAILSTNYRGTITVDFETKSSKITVRPDNRLSRALSKTWVKVLLIIFLIYWPFIWLYKRFHPRGGGRWEVCGGAYALKYWQRYDTAPLVDVGSSSTEAQPPSYTQEARTETRVIGVREGEWFQRWEGVLRMAVNSRTQSDIPLTEPGFGPGALNPVALTLDGYTSPW